MQQKGFTLIELLIVIAIITILAVVVVLTLNPAELLKQSRDANRISDLNTLRSALALYLVDVAAPHLADVSGSDNYTYCWMTATGTVAAYGGGIGVSGATGFGGTCGVFTDGYIATATSSQNANVDGTGWLPVNFNLITAGSPIAKLPVDPVNNASFYYAYAASSSLTFELDGHMESVKFATTSATNVQSNDGGDSPFEYEVGTVPGLKI
jgi:prepilin-type N-terminal cleavage/methylation domain-containing protein